VNEVARCADEGSADEGSACGYNRAACEVASQLQARGIFCQRSDEKVVTCRVRVSDRVCRYMCKDNREIFVRGCMVFM
jgi:hypothetical protein